MTTEQLSVDVSHDENGVRISPSGEIDYGSVSRLRTALMDAVKDDTGDVIVDLGSVEFIDSTGLSVLVQGKQRLEEAGRALHVENPIPRVARTFELAGVLDYLT